MSSPAPRAPGRAPGPATLVAGLGLVAAVAAFLAGQWMAGRATPAHDRPAARAAARARPATFPDRPWTSGQPKAAPLAAAAGLPPVPPPTSSPTRATPAVVARATAETAAVLEQARGELTSRCWPRGGLASGHDSTLVTFNVTFDAAGREIARGLGEDRRARAPELVRCLQRLPLGSLRISPTGANVGVKVAMRLP